MTATERARELGEPIDPRDELAALLGELTGEHERGAKDFDATGEDAVLRSACWGALAYRLREAAEVATRLRCGARYEAHANWRARQADQAIARYARRADVPPADPEDGVLDDHGHDGEERDLFATAGALLAADSTEQAA